VIVSQNRRWINTRVEYQWDTELQQYVEVSVEGYWYAGEMALAHNTPNLDQDSYAFYNDGTESGSTIIGTANNSQNLDADTTYLVRFLIQEDNGGESSNFTAQLEYDVNSSGTWNNVTSTSNNVRAVTSGSLGTDGGNTTQRLGSGTYLTTNGGIDNGDGSAGGSALDFTGNTEAEVVYAIQLRSADLSNNDSVTLRVAGVDTYTNTATAIASIPNNTVVSLTSQSLSLTEGTLGVQANVDTNVSLTPQSLAITEGTLTVSQVTAVEVTLTPQALAVAEGTLSVTRNKQITLTPQALTVTPNTLSVQANVDTNVSLTPQALTLTEGTLTIVAFQNVEITPTLQALVVTPNTLTVQANVDTDVSLTPQALTIAEGTLGVSADTTVSLTPQALTLTEGTLDITALQDTTVSLTPQALTLTEGTLVITTLQNAEITLTPQALVLTEGTLGVAADTTVSPIPQALTVTEGTLVVTAEQSVTVTLTPQALTVTEGTLVVSQDTSIDVSLTPQVLTLTEGTLTVGIQINNAKVIQLKRDHLRIHNNYVKTRHHKRATSDMSIKFG